MKLFVLLSRVPYPLEKGDKLRAFHQLKQLSQKHEIYLFALNDTPLHADALPVLKSFCKEVIVFNLPKIQIIWNIFLAFISRRPIQTGYFYNAKAQQKINNFINKIKPDHIFCQLIRVSEYVKSSTYPKTLDYMDAFSKGYERRIYTVSALYRPFYVMEYKRLLNYERSMFDCFDHKIIISKQDRDLINHVENKKIHIILNGIDTAYFKPVEEEKIYDIIFSGNMSYAPNVQAAEYIVCEILPIVRLKIKNVKLVLAGATPALRVSALASENVIVTGWIKDMRTFYSRSKVFIAPMQIGIGLQNKLLEAMAMKIPCVTSNLANNALNAASGKEILVGASPNEFAQHIITLLENKELANSIAEQGFNFVKTTYNWEQVAEQMERIMLKK